MKVKKGFFDIDGVSMRDLTDDVIANFPRSVRLGELY